MSTRRLTLFAACLFVPVVALANAAPAASRAQVRKELAQFFAHAGNGSPALGDISKSPAALQAIQEHINAMSDQEIDDLQKMMTAVPDWQNAPQEITKMLPQGALKKIDAASAQFEAQAPQAEKMRDDIGALSAVLNMLPDEKLKELGIQRSQVGSLQAAVTQLSPLQVGVLNQKLASNSTWQTNAQTALAGMPPALQKGALALSRHGPLTKDDLQDLEKFRAQVITLLDRVNSLPEATRKQLKIEDLGANIMQIDRATPDVIFMLREQMPPEQMKKLSASVDLMDRIANMTDSDRKKLESFRTDLESIANHGADAAANEQKIEALTPAELLVMQDQMPDFTTWKEQTNAYLAASADPGLKQRITALQQANPDPAAVASLEQFRSETLQYIDSVSSVDPAMAKTARANVTNAGLPELEVLRTLSTVAPTMSPRTRLHIAANFQASDCNFTILDFSGVCQSIIDFVNSVASGAASVVQTALNATITAVQNALQAAIDGVSSALTAVTNTVDTLVNGIVSTVGQIWNFVQTIPDLVWNALKTAINAFLDLPLGNTGLTIRTLISGGISQVVPALQQALNLGENFWNSLNDSLPLLPCPPAGFSTPFGAVGTDEAVTKYNRYHFFLEKIVGMIPSDAISLEVKIPAEVLYSAWDYLGLCLQDAASAADAAQQAANFNTLTTGLTTITNNEGSLSNQISSEFAALANLTNSNDSSLTTLINNQGTSLTSLIDDKTTEIENLIKQKDADAQKLELQLQIELNLAAGEGNALAMFELPQAQGGYLETARDIVNNEISNMLAAGQAIGQAQKLFSDGLNAMSSGKFKDAYDSFQKAYQELTKKN